MGRYSRRYDALEGGWLVSGPCGDIILRGAGAERISMLMKVCLDKGVLRNRSDILRTIIHSGPLNSPDGRQGVAWKMRLDDRGDADGEAVILQAPDPGSLTSECQYIVAVGRHRF